MNSAIRQIQQIINGKHSGPPIAYLIGFRPIEVSEGYTVFTLNTKEEHQNPMGTVHGGVFCDLADSAMGTAYMTLLEDGESFTTVELKINFLKPVRNTELVAKAKVVKKGQTIGLVECDVFDEKNSLVARASSTCMTLRGKTADGR
ncbi:PaaI family thioesterase [Sporosarcina koreensis]|uniref:PaaI family thioesterase n=1 Tax=Sporosarcina koreensis TaxID=334735 RepID=UPI00075AE32A|nr:PaaI family thioesterase [Sporosarcina koreensis]